jgi:hypothetical protein
MRVDSQHYAAGHEKVDEIVVHLVARNVASDVRRMANCA